MKINKENFIGYGLQFIMVLLIGLIFLLEYLKKEYYLLTASCIFFILGALGEQIFMKHFYSKTTNNITSKDKFIKKLKDGFLWVHANIKFTKLYGTTIYNFKKIGVLTSFISYAIMLLYLGIVYLLYNLINYYAFLIYLIPIITNSYSFWRNHYYILPKLK